ncbi:MAG: GntR family transcriptional regulator [Verrucomicrobia bacterium]|nr:GntR family transcriptional regulator [Verrucomicrobiota bacterium]
MEELSRLQIQRLRGIEVQVQDYIRELITSGQIKSETRLPPTEQLAGLWGVGTMTVQKALTPLVKEGLLIRRPKSGTFVRKREERLTCVGIYDVTAVGGSLYGLALHAALKEELMQTGIEADVWIDPRSHEQSAEPWAPFLKAATNREFQALIAVGIATPRWRWLSKMPVPAAFQGFVANIPSCVDFDMPQFAELGLRELAKQGCQSVGLIAPLTTDIMPPGGLHDLHGGFFERFIKVSQELGLTIKNPWMRLLPHAGAMRGHSQEKFGYEQFLELWRLKERPDGLIVYPDTAARGAILAARERQVRVPGDLKVVLHKNESIELLCPMPATLAISSERKMAKALMAQVQKQFRGERCEPISLPFRLMALETA